MGKFPCPLCNTPLDIRTSKAGKPYLTCDEDGVQLFVRYQKGIDRLDELSSRDVSLLEKFVVCNPCQVAVRTSLKKIRDPLFREAGLYCPSCEELLLKAPPDWRERLKD